MRDVKLERRYRSNSKTNWYRLRCQAVNGRAGGGYTSADAHNVDKSAATITLRTSIPQNTTRALAIPLSRASNTGRIGSTIIVREISFAGLKLPGPYAHHLDQPVPGPAEQMPTEWQSLPHV